jgi:DedD protein
MADPADINVDELRRRARRRLVGAIVLALGAAVIVPMLLESDPKPLGESVAVKIPQVDDGKFVNRLSDAAPKTDAASRDARKDAVTEGTPRKSVTEAERAVVTPGAKAPKYDTQIAADKAAAAPAASSAPPSVPPPPPSSPPLTPPKDAPPSTGSAAPAPQSAAPSAATDTAAPKSDAKPAAPPKPEPKAEPKLEAKAEPKAPVEVPPPATNGVPRDGFSVQLAAFSDDKGANALASRLKRGGYPAYTEPLKTSRGTLWRVRVGPYPTRDAANGVRDKLKTEGQSGIVAPSR